MPQHGQPPTAAACLELSLLGGFRLRCRGRPVAPPTSAQRLLALLALHDGDVSRTYVAGTLWLDSSEDRAAGSLRSALWRLRQTDPALVEAPANRLRLGPDVTVDVRRMVAASQRINEGPDLGTVDDGLFCRDLLPDWYEDWVLLERERLRQVRLAALEGLASRLIEEGDLAGAIRAGLAAVQCEALRESSHRVLVRAHIADGNYGEAVRQYRLYAHLLDDEMGLSPSPLMERLVAPLMVR